MKTNTSIKIFTLCILFSCFLLAGCSPNSQTPTETPNIIPTADVPGIGAEIPTTAPSDTFTPTSSSTPSLTPTITDTPTFTPSPTPNMVMPGNYYVGKCAEAPGQYGATIMFCVTGVRVTDERHMFFDVSWKVFNIPSGVTATKKSDYGNRKMYLTDNLGNRYDHIDGGGAAYRSVSAYPSTPGNIKDPGMTGWFEFGSPPVGALKFDFHDDDNHLVVKDIVLIPGYGYIQYDTLPLDQYPLVVEYDEDKWNPTKAQDDTNMLTHKTMPSCTIQPRQPSEPSGKFKSLTTVNDIDYKIYGFYDDAQKIFIREYIYESGIKGLEPGVRPYFYITIPEDKTLECIVAVNNVLGRLALPNP